MKRDWPVALTGVLAIVLAIVGFAVGGEPPDVDEPVREIIAHYVDDKTAIQVSIVIGGFAMLALVFFGAYVSRALRDADAPRSSFITTLPQVGTAIMAVGIAIDATILLALSETAEDIEPASVLALQALWDNDFIPIALGTLVFLLSTGISIIRTGLLPKWLGWVAIALSVVAISPIGFVSFLGGLLWIAIVSILLALRGRRGTEGAPPPAAQPGV